jgi:hypothetical protein
MSWNRMPILNPDHLFEQAERLADPQSPGRRRQVDVRRAVSAAYYGLFHFTLAQLADLLMGASLRSTKVYSLAYRSVSHQRLREFCSEVRKATPPPRYNPYLPSEGFGADLKQFAGAAVELQQRRHDADYDPAERFLTTDARAAVDTARAARSRFLAASADQQRAFLNAPRLSATPVSLSSCRPGGRPGST